MVVLMVLPESERTRNLEGGVTYPSPVKTTIRHVMVMFKGQFQLRCY